VHSRSGVRPPDLPAHAPGSPGRARAARAAGPGSGAPARAQVSQQGDVLYVLPGNFRAVLRARSAWLRAEPALAAARGAGAYAVRVGFGTALIASVALVAISVVALLTAASSSERDNRRRAPALQACLPKQAGPRLEAETGRTRRRGCGGHGQLGDGGGRCGRLVVRGAAAATRLCFVQPSWRLVCGCQLTLSVCSLLRWEVVSCVAAADEASPFNFGHHYD